MILTIAEKPELAEIIANAFGNAVKKQGYYECAGNNFVTWCFGHMLVLTPPAAVNPSYEVWKMDDLPMDLTAVSHQVKTTENGYVERQYKIICDLLKKSSSVIHAGDPDDEGELLVREILWLENYTKPVKRLLLNDLNINAAKKALAKMEDGNSDKFVRLALKALARAKGDQIFGLNMTRYFTLLSQRLGGRGKLTCGRVQTPMLGLIVARYKAFNSHVKSYYYDVSSTHHFLKDFPLKLIANDDFAVDGKIIDPDVAQKIKEACEGKPSSVASVKVEDKATAAPLPFDLLGLQSYMLKDKISPDETLELTQSLRSNYSAISYNRSDCRYLSSDQHEEAPDTLSALKKYVGDGALNDVINNATFDISRKGKAFNDKNITSHTAIIPTPNPRGLEKLSVKERKVYEAIVLRYLLQFVDDKKYKSAKVVVDCAGYQYSTSATKLISAGWSSIEADDNDEPNDDGEDSQPLFESISVLSNGEQSSCTGVNISKAETKPLPLYTMKTFLEDLKRVSKYVSDPRIKKLLLSKDEGKKGERGGIGTPATRSTIIKNLENTGYYTIQSNKLIPTEKGIKFIESLPVSVTAPDMTALWHEQQTMILDGEMELSDFIININQTVAELMKADVTEGMKQVADSQPKGKCFCCGGDMHLNPKVFVCQNESCGLKIWRTISKKDLTDLQMKTLMERGSTNLIKGFKSKADKPYDAILKIDKDKKSVVFEFPPRK